MRDILLIGAGKIGETIAELLCGSGDYRVTVADRSDLQLQRLPRRAHMKTLVLDVSDEAALATAMKGRFAVLSAAPYSVTGKIAIAAHLAGVHYLDLTEDVANTRLVNDLGPARYLRLLLDVLEGGYVVAPDAEDEAEDEE